MAAYLVVTLTVSDPRAFGRYRDAIRDLETRYGGRYLVRAPVGDWLEGGGAEGERVVVMEFPDAAHVRDFIASDAYQAAKRLREGAAVLTMRLVTEDQ
jgi:uncharacterized protein (DUF1330 family)